MPQHESAHGHSGASQQILWQNGSRYSRSPPISPASTPPTTPPKNRRPPNNTNHHSDDHHATLLMHGASAPAPTLPPSRAAGKGLLSMWCVFYSAFMVLLVAVCLLVTLFVFPDLSFHGCNSLVALGDSIPLSVSATRLSHFDASLVQQCLGWGTDLNLPSSSSSSTSLTSSSALAASSLTCQLAPSAVLSAFFPRLHALYPSVTTYRPSFSCHTGLYLVMDFPYRDGMGNSMWSYALGVGVAMSLNATLVHDWFSATHDQEEGNMQRDAHFRFGEWEVSREAWDRCGEETSVKQHQHTIDTMYEEWRWDSSDLHKTREWIRQRQADLAHEANLTHLGATATATASYRFLNFTSAKSLSAVYDSVTLPQVLHQSPGMTIHIKSFQSHQDWGYEPGVMMPSVAVAEVLEARYLAQQDEWRRRLQGDTEQQRVSWLASETVAVAIPVRRGDITMGTEGSELTIPLDLRQRVMTDSAIVRILNQTLTLVRNIRPHSVSYNSSSFTTTLTSALSGQQILDRMRFTIYSEGSPAGFTRLVSTLTALGIPQSHIRLALNGRASLVFSLLTESDIAYLAPSSYSYASTCYFNSESIKIGSGWTFSRFGGCRNFIYRAVDAIFAA